MNKKILTALTGISIASAVLIILNFLGFNNHSLYVITVIAFAAAQIAHPILAKKVEAEEEKAYQDSLASNDKRGPVLTCENLSMTFGKNRVLNNINVNVNPGELHCIIGPNGGGKSTFIKTLLGQLHHEGTITLEWPGTPGTIGYVPQMIEIDKTIPLTVENFISLCIQKQPSFLGVSSRYKKAVQEVLKKVDMLDKRKYLFSELSGGERQRVLFAQALIPSPDLLILDEPMNSIDRTGASIFNTLIDELREKGVSVIWVHHDLAEVREKADYVTCINREMIFAGKPEDVMDEKHLLEIFTAQPVQEA